MSEIFIAPPNPVGRYEIGGQYGMHVTLSKKPMWIHRVFSKILLGWEWYDYK